LSAHFRYLADREENKQFFTKEFQDFSKTAAELLLQMGLIKEVPDVTTLADTSAVAN
ncbi:ABC transporter permease, partial [Mesorhizobium sp. M00.F.Ca.ET.149.01.1.1]